MVFEMRIAEFYFAIRIPHLNYRFENWNLARAPF